MLLSLNSALTGKCCCLHFKSSFSHSSAIFLPKTYYDTLGIKSNASKEDIKASYFKLSKELHPDLNKNPEAVNEFRQVQEAYKILSNEKTRLDYDRKVRSEGDWNWEEDLRPRQGRRSQVERDIHKRWQQEQIMKRWQDQERIKRERREDPFGFKKSFKKSPLSVEDDPRFHEFKDWVNAKAYNSRLRRDRWKETVEEMAHRNLHPQPRVHIRRLKFYIRFILIYLPFVLITLAATSSVTNLATFTDYDVVRTDLRDGKKCE